MNADRAMLKYAISLAEDECPQLRFGQIIAYALEFNNDDNILNELESMSDVELAHCITSYLEELRRTHGI